MKKLLIIFTSILLLFTVSCSNNQEETFNYNKLFNDELIAVRNEEGLIGFVNNKGQEVFEPQFEFIYSSRFDKTGNIIAIKDGLKQLINVNGDVIYDGTEGFVIESNCSGHISFKNESNDKLGIKDLKNNTIYESDKFTFLKILGDNFVLAFDTNGQAGAIDYNGNILVEHHYDYMSLIGSYSDGNIYIGENGEVVMLFDSTGTPLLDEYYDGYTYCPNVKYVSLRKDDLYYLYNLETKELSDFYSYEHFLVEDNETTFSIDLENTVSFINTKGELLFNLEEKYRDGLTHLYRFNDNGYLLTYFEESPKAYDSYGNLLGETTDEKQLININDKYTSYMYNYNKYTIEDRNGDIIVESEHRIHLTSDTNIYLEIDGEDIVMFNFDEEELHRASSRGSFYAQYGLYKFYDYVEEMYYICNSKGEKINSEYYLDDQSFHFSRFFEDGYIVAQQDGLYGVLNSNGKVVVPFKYSGISNSFYAIAN